MSGSCCAPAKTPAVDPRWRKALWIALIVNAGMFVVELSAGEVADPRALQADALDFFGDAANYAISLGVAGFALAWRGQAALIKGITLVALGIYVIVSALLAVVGGESPHAYVMGGVGVAALIANVAVALMLYRFRQGDRTCARCGYARAMTRSPIALWLPPRRECSAPVQRGPISSSPRSWRRSPFRVA